MLSACCSLGAGARASLVRERRAGLRCRAVDIVPFDQTSVLALGRHNRGVATSRDQTSGAI